MKTIAKTLLIAAIVCILSVSKSSAAMTAARNPLTGETVYSFHFNLNRGTSDKEAYEMAQKWFTENPAEFNAANGTHMISRKAVAKIALDDTYKNSSPFISAYPGTNWVAGHNVVKYTGGELSAISIMYIEFDMVVQIEDAQVTATLSHVTYHHYNPFNYAPAGIANAAGKAFQPTGKFENLAAVANSNPDIKDASDFLNQHVDRLLGDLQQTLGADKPLTASR